MKVRTRKARINRALARELWLTPHLKKSCKLSYS